MTPVLAEDLLHLRSLVDDAIRAHGPACDLNDIDVSCISSFEALFKNSPFVGDISAWDMRAARTTVDMFYGSAFNGDISKWNVERLRNANHMFHESAFNGDIARWNPINLESADFMFAQSPFAGDVADWHLPFLNSCMHMFDTPTFHGDLSAWTLPSGCLYGLMLDGDFNGKLPRVAARNIADAYGMLLGNSDVVDDYAKRTPFGVLHAELLLADRTWEWASQEVVRWATEMGELGRAMGLEHEALVQLMVQAYPTRAAASRTIVEAHAFEAPM